MDQTQLISTSQFVSVTVYFFFSGLIFLMGKSAELSGMDLNMKI